MAILLGHKLNPSKGDKEPFFIAPPTVVITHKDAEVPPAFESISVVPCCRTQRDMMEYVLEGFGCTSESSENKLLHASVYLLLDDVKKQTVPQCSHRVFFARKANQELPEGDRFIRSFEVLCFRHVVEGGIDPGS